MVASNSSHQAAMERMIPSPFGAGQISPRTTIPPGDSPFGICPIGNSAGIEPWNGGVTAKKAIGQGTTAASERNSRIVNVVTVNDEDENSETASIPMDSAAMDMLAPLPSPRCVPPSKLWSCIPLLPKSKTPPPPCARDDRISVRAPSLTAPRASRIVAHREGHRMAQEVGHLRTTVQKMERRINDLEDTVETLDARLVGTLQLLQSSRPPSRWRERNGNTRVSVHGVGVLPIEPGSLEPVPLLEKGGSPAAASLRAGVDGSASGPPNNDAGFPEGGTRAWLVAAGAAGLLFSTMGYNNSFGVFQAYYESNLLASNSPDQIAWIGSTQAFLMFAGGFVGGPMFDRYGAAVVCFPCCISFPPFVPFPLPFSLSLYLYLFLFLFLFFSLFFLYFLFLSNMGIQ
jgi:hypothetical protein